MSKRRCSICASADVDTINAQLLAGVNQKSVAEQFSGTSRFAISRHWRNCLAPAPAPTGTGDSREEVAKWLRRADDQYLLASANSDQRGAVASLVAGLRAAESLTRCEEREAEAAPDAEGDGKLSVEVMDRVVAWWDRVQAENDEKSTQLALEEAQRLRCPDLYEVFLRLWDSPALKERVLEFCRELFAEEEANEPVSQ
jgi:hypothetical protein